MEQNERRLREERDRWFADDGAVAAAQEAAQHRRQKRSAWNAPGWLTFVLFVVLAALIMALAYLKDESMPWEDDLMRPIFTGKTPDVSAPARMKAALTAASRILRDEPALLAPWDVDLAMLSTVMDNGAAALDNLRDLMEEKPSEWEPRSMLWKFDDLGADPAWRTLLRLKEAESVHLVRRGQEQKAFDSAMDLVALGSVLERVDAWPSFMDRALDCHEIGTRLLARLLAKTQLPEEKLRVMQEEEFTRFTPSITLLGEAMSGFYAYERKLLLGPEMGEPPLPAGYLPARSGSYLFFKPHATLRLFAESLRELKNDMTDTAFVRADQIESRLLRRMSSSGILGGSNKSGEDYFATRIRNYASLPDRNALARARHAIVLTLFATRRYIMREARVPAKLDDLKPKYLRAVPLDPFSGEPLRYDPARGVIWSFGLNFKDDGGKPSPTPLADIDEPAVEIGIGMAKAGR